MNNLLDIFSVMPFLIVGVFLFFFLFIAIAFISIAVKGKQKVKSKIEQEEMIAKEMKDKNKANICDYCGSFVVQGEICDSCGAKKK